MNKFFRKALLLLFVILIFTGFTRGATHVIQALDTSFTPDSISILVGDTVIWSWISGTHSITSNGIPAGAAPWNELLDNFHPTFTYVVTIPGTYHYISVPDIPDMEGEFTASYPIGISTPMYSSVNFNITSNLVQDKINVQFQIPLTGEITFYISDVSGKTELLLNERIASGTYNRDFYMNEALPSELYFITMRYFNINLTRKMVIR